eukprot:1143234-Alexandrium_andersonii.AAC.1
MASASSIGGGGYRQKAARAREVAAQEPAKRSSLTRFLLEKWAWGDISAPLLQQIAAHAVSDGASGPEL